MKGNWVFISLSYHLCTSPIFSVYSHMALNIDKECIAEIFLIFFSFFGNVLQSCAASWVIEFPPQEGWTKRGLRTEQKENLRWMILLSLKYSSTNNKSISAYQYTAVYNDLLLYHTHKTHFMSIHSDFKATMENEQHP